MIQANRNFFRGAAEGGVRFQKLATLETLVSCLPRLHTNHASDTIYALLAAASDQKKLGEFWTQHPDYHEEPLEVFQELTLYCIQTSKSLDIICRHWAPARELKHRDMQTNKVRLMKLPTWMLSIDEVPQGPCDEVLGRINKVSFVGNPGRKFYNASRGTRGVAIFNDVQTVKHNVWTKSMRVCGFELGRIEQLERSRNETTFGHISEQTKEIAEWENGSKKVPDHLWRTLVADRGPDGAPPPIWYPDACLYWLERFRPTSRAVLLYAEDHPDIAREFLV
jgi:hypothetical protein